MRQLTVPLQATNTKRGLPPHTGVDKPKTDGKQALTDHTKDLLALFKAKSKRWMDYQTMLHARWGVVHTESHI